MQPKISVIVPVYNVEKYLTECLNSLVQQTYENLEIIVVDDGSTDLSGKICDDFAKKYDSVTVLHKQNGGQSSARNAGTRLSSGEYIAFVDSDDYVSKDCFQYLYDLIKRHSATVAVGAFCQFVDGTKPNISICNNKEIELSKEMALEETCYCNYFTNSACGKLYPTSIVREHPYPEGKIYEDIATTYKIFADVDSIAVGNKPILFYRQHAESTLHEPLSDRHLCAIEIFEEKLSFMKQNYPILIPAVKSHFADKVLGFMPRLIDGSKHSKCFFKLVKKAFAPYYFTVIKDSKFAIKHKIALTMVMCGYTPMRLFYLVRKISYRSCV